MIKKMKKTKKKKYRIPLILLFLSMIVLADAFLIEPNRLKVRYEIIYSPKIPEELNNYTILVFSDLHYNNFVKKNRAEKVVSVINSVGADTVLFLGDLYDHPTKYPITLETRYELAEILQGIETKYGKFAILGNHDYDSPETVDIVIDTLEYANFEVLLNSNTPLYYEGEEYINLIAIDSLSLGNPDIARAYKGIENSDFNIVFTHCPDIFDEIDSSLTDLVLSGHSHGGQVNIPFLSRFFTPYGARKYYSGKYTSGNLILDITNGVGTTWAKVRFNAPPEIVVYRLVNENQ